MRLPSRGKPSREEPRLIEDLACAQVAVKARLAGRAERARERTARLRRYAQRRAPAAVLHEHRLDLFAVAQTKESFGRLFVLRSLHDHRLDRRERDSAFPRSRAHLGGPGRHLVNAAQQLLIRGAIELAQTVRLKSERGGEILNAGKSGARDDVAQPRVERIAGHAGHCTTPASSSKRARTALRSFQTNRFTASISPPVWRRT